ncbi:DDT domain-containing protein DDR4-like [Chenopodium quinoa]|uniref:DDT domain-containing protein DDR4-like n=1 Tax=Chenopodium quinoa TaxID=63459 RepID=UPI000B7756BA|nr:DDT domain-containing protein DDR4-like [Chenopodium quinoa]
MADNNNNNHGGNPESGESEEDSSSPLSKLRRRWELASVLNFFSVFEPLIGKESKMSAEEIEDALINPNSSLTKLHIALLKGIRPVNKKLSEPDYWVKSLCLKLAEWWPWVAEGKVPLVPAKGEEVSRYKELDPTIRLLMLKALCEIRALQDDLVSNINDALKEGAQISQFRKDKIGQDRNGVSYWYDGDPVIGHRLYMEIDNGMLKQKHRGKNCLDLKETNSEWEILATNLDEFRKVSERFSSCQVGVEAAVHETIETEVIPVLEKLQKKKERDLKRRQREEAYMSGCHSYAAGVTRSCRSRRPVKYTFDDFDRTIEEAIKETRKGKVRKVERNDTKHPKHGKSGDDSGGDLQNNAHDGSPASTSKDKQNDQQDEGDSNGEEIDQLSKGSDIDEEDDQQGEGSENDEDYNEQGEGSENDDEDNQQGEGSENDEEDDLQSEGSDKGKDINRTDIAGKSDNEVVNDSESDSSDFEHENVKQDGAKHDKVLSQGQKDNVATGLKMKKNSDRTSRQNLHEGRNPEAKNRYRQRPTLNSALSSFVVPDSEDESSPENSSGDASSEEDPSEVADSEDEISS